MDLADIKICKTLIINVFYFADSLNSYGVFKRKKQVICYYFDLYLVINLPVSIYCFLFFFKNICEFKSFLLLLPSDCMPCITLQ